MAKGGRQWSARSLWSVCHGRPYPSSRRNASAINSCSAAVWLMCPVLGFGALLAIVPLCALLEVYETFYNAKESAACVACVSVRWSASATKSTHRSPLFHYFHYFAWECRLQKPSALWSDDHLLRIRCCWLLNTRLGDIVESVLATSSLRIVLLIFCYMVVQHTTVEETA